MMILWDSLQIICGKKLLGSIQMKQLVRIKLFSTFICLYLLIDCLVEIVQFGKPLADDEFVLANLRASGFYRINYDNHYWNRIIKQLLTKKDVYRFVILYNLTLIKEFISVIGHPN
jgi:hypothetical protein